MQQFEAKMPGGGAGDAVIVVGDIHGCLEQLDEMLELTRGYENHTYVFLGDYIDRGPDSEGVINRLRELDAVFLLGNHEEMLMDRLKGWGEAYFEDPFLSTRLSRASLDWMRGALVGKYETDSYVFVHAGLNKSKPFEDQSTRDFIWTKEDGDYRSLTGKTVVHGHTIVREPVVVGNRININTGCGCQGPLTGLVLPEMKFVSSTNSPGVKLDWEKIRKELEEELKEYDSFGTLEEIE